MKKILMNDFSERATNVFDPYLQSIGFEPTIKDRDKVGCRHIYRRDNQYTEIVANIHPHDRPAYYNIILGEGEDTFPESDWNSVALWRFKNEIDANENAAEYLFEGIKDLSVNLGMALEELKKYGDSFLHSDLKLFHKIRSKVNHSREPYKIYKPGKGGTLAVYSEPESVKLKKKFSI